MAGLDWKTMFPFWRWKCVSNCSLFCDLLDRMLSANSLSFTQGFAGGKIRFLLKKGPFLCPFFRPAKNSSPESMTPWWEGSQTGAGGGLKRMAFRAHHG